MRLGAINGLCAVLLLLFPSAPFFNPETEPLVRMGAQIQFMHGMATFASATFMNIGAKWARLAPAFFLSGIAAYCGAIYLEAAGHGDAFGIVKPLGITSFAVGWLILGFAAKDIDLG